MANLQVKKLPGLLRLRLRHPTISEIAQGAIERESAHLEWQERLARRPSADLDVSAATLLEEERQELERAHTLE